MFDILLSVLTGGATGIIGSIIGRVFSFVEAWQAEKKAKNDHGRTIEMHRLQAELRAGELESERRIVEEEQDGKIRAASYEHDRSIDIGYPWVGAILRLVRPVLTVLLMGIVWSVYFTTKDLGIRAEIIQSVLFMASSALLWWFGDRGKRPAR